MRTRMLITVCVLLFSLGFSGCGNSLKSECTYDEFASVWQNVQAGVNEAIKDKTPDEAGAIAEEARVKYAKKEGFEKGQVFTISGYVKVATDTPGGYMIILDSEEGLKGDNKYDSCSVSFGFESPSDNITALVIGDFVTMKGALLESNWFTFYNCELISTD